MYSDYYSEAVRRVTRALADARVPSLTETERILARTVSGALDLDDAAALLQLGQLPAGEPAVQRVRAAVEARFRPAGSAVREIAPIYLSNDCIDRCKYCNFAEQHDIPRLKLTPEQIASEVRKVVSEGSAVIEFTLATDPYFTPDRLEEAIRIAVQHVGDRPGAGVLLCSDHQSEETYRGFAACGLRGMVQWDETLDHDAYEKWHGHSERKGIEHFFERIDNHDRAMRAGLDVATGALFGLADVAYETLMQVLKARYLRETYGRAPFTFGTARLKGTGPRDWPATQLATDETYEMALLIFKLCEPEVGRWLQTREEFEPNLRRMLDGDYFTYRCGSVTPGGHEVNRDVPQTLAGQFRVKELTRGQFEDGVTTAGFRIVYAWMDGLNHVPVGADARFGGDPALPNGR